ncbi:MAG: hypothetical protein PHT88_05420 [Candidatus Moranbacteria bacterium]|nr:hypothetical protein [Candidatus Moranbacteria bacterium]
MLRTIFPKKVFSRFGGGNFRKSGAMKTLMERPELQEALKTPREQREFFEHIHEAGTTGDRGFTEKELKPMLKDLAADKTDHLTDKDVYKISHALMNRRTGKYIPPADAPKKTGWF